jgi:hypothetical protein
VKCPASNLRRRDANCIRFMRRWLGAMVKRAGLSTALKFILEISRIVP